AGGTQRDAERSTRPHVPERASRVRIAPGADFPPQVDARAHPPRKHPLVAQPPAPCWLALAPCRRKSPGRLGCATLAAPFFWRKGRESSPARGRHWGDFFGQVENGGIFAAQIPDASSSGPGFIAKPLHRLSA